MAQATATSSIPLPLETGAPDKSTNKKNWRELMSQSTIYKRHERRLMKNMEKPHDPRPKAIRVLAGLPGFRTVIPAYQPSTGSKNININGDQTSSVGKDTTTFTATTFVVEDHQASEHSTWSSLLVMFNTGLIGAAAEAYYGGSAKAASPFQAGISSVESRAVPVVGEQGQVSFFRLPFSNPSTSASTVPVSTVQLKTGASTAALLFGVKTFATNQFTTADDEEETTSNLSLASLSASALAGAIVGTVRTLQLSETRFLVSPVSQQTTATGMLLQNNMLARHVIGATLYFSSYEILKSYWGTASSNSSGVSHQEATKSPVAIAISGAMSGACYQFVLLYRAACLQNTMKPQQLMTSVTQSQMYKVAPAVLKVAPAHALLFLGYEWAQSGL